MYEHYNQVMNMKKIQIAYLSKSIAVVELEDWEKENEEEEEKGEGSLLLETENGEEEEELEEEEENEEVEEEELLFIEHCLPFFLSYSLENVLQTLSPPEQKYSAA